MHRVKRSRRCKAERNLVTAAKQRYQDQHRNWNAEKPQQHVSHPTLLLIGPIGTQGLEMLFHGILSLVSWSRPSMGDPRAAWTHYYSAGSSRKSAGFGFRCRRGSARRKTHADNPWRTTLDPAGRHGHRRRR